MTCREFNARVHDYIDRQLSATGMVEMRQHAELCPSCSRRGDELLEIIQFISRREQLVPLAQRRLLARIERERNRSLWRWLAERCDALYTYGRDLDKGIVWARLTALPITLCFFILLMFQFSSGEMHELTYPVLWTPSSSMANSREPIVRQVNVRQQINRVNDLMKVAWRIPYEDQLQLVAEITPEGHAEIEDVLEYPKNQGLLEAVGLSLSQTEFDTEGMQRPRLIYSFQKIDVYDELGL